MGPGRRTSGRRVRRGLVVLPAASLAATVLLGSADGGLGTTAATAPLTPPAAEEPLRPAAVTASATAAEQRVAPPPPPVPPAVPVDAPAVLGQVQAAAGAAGGTVTVVVVDAYQRQLLAGPDATRPALTASLVKLLVVAELLARQGGNPPPEDRALMERASTSSDDAAMSTLWVRHDGPGLIAAATARLGLTGTAPPGRTGQWGESLMSAADVATFLSRIAQAYGTGIADTLTGWLRAATPTAADGFDQRFGLLSPASAAAGPVAAKQGWMCCVGGRRQLHSAGLLPDGRAVVLLGDFPAGTSWRAAAAALDAAAAAVVAGTAGQPPQAG
ncbi:LppW family protein [Geodermatophilus sp. SYSU D00815]